MNYLNEIKKYFDFLPESILTINNEHNILFANQAFYSAFNLEDGFDLSKIEMSGIKDLEGVINIQINKINIHFYYMKKSSVIYDENICFITLIEANKFIRTTNDKSIDKFADSKIQNHLDNYTCGINVLQKYIDLCRQDGEIFSAGLFKLIHPTDIKAEKVNDFCDRFIDVVERTTRHTDIFIKVENNEFMLIFPKCILSIADTIMSSIENKFQAESQAGKFDDVSQIEIGLLEYNKDLCITNTEFMDRLRKEIPILS